VYEKVANSIIFKQLGHKYDVADPAVASFVDHNVYRQKLSQRIEYLRVSEQMLVALLFSDRISLEDFRTQVATLISDEDRLATFLAAIDAARAEKLTLVSL